MMTTLSLVILKTKQMHFMVQNLFIALFLCSCSMSGQLTTTIDSPKTSSEKQPSPSTISDFAKDMDRTDEGVITVMQKEKKYIGELPIPS